MPRRVQDIVPGDRRSIRDVVVSKKPDPAGDSISAKTAKAPGPRTAKEKGEREIPIHRSYSEQAKRMPVTPPLPPKKPQQGSRGKRKAWIIAGAIVIVLVLAGAAFEASAGFAHATFIIVPRTIPIAVNGTYIAQDLAATGTLPYELMTVSGSASTTVAAADGPQVSLKASGQVTLYNAYSSQAQRLIAGTRLADSSGLIYLLTSSVVIPGDSSSGAVPGSTNAAIVAAQPGPSYNISAADPVSDFKVVAFQGTPRYAAIYARLASDVTGGFIGTQKTVSPSLLASTTASLKSQISASLSAQAAAMVPVGSILYDGAGVSVFSAPVVGGNSPSQASVSLSGTYYAILFRTADLVAKLAPNQADSFDGMAYTAPGLEDLSFSIANPGDFSPQQKSALIVRLQGAMSLAGTVPAADLKAKLAGLTLADTANILRQYSPVIDVSHSSGELVPPWSSTVPTDLSRISVVIQGQ